MELLAHPLFLLALFAVFALVFALLRKGFGVSGGTSTAIGVAAVLAIIGGVVSLSAVTSVLSSLQIEVGGLLFGGLATLVLVSALGVALSKNILYSGFALMGTLVGVAGLYLFMGADFVGVAQLLIYIGGILVLILFAVLLTNRISDVRVSNRSVQLPLGAGVVTLLLAFLAYVLVDTNWKTTEAVSTPTTARLGDAFLREYLLPFELISLVLLMALVGAMVIARRAAKDEPVDAKEAPGLERLE